VRGQDVLHLLGLDQGDGHPLDSRPPTATPPNPIWMIPPAMDGGPPPKRGAGAALGCAAPGRTNAATTRPALGEGLRAVVVFAVYSSTKTAPAMLARSAIVAGKKPKPAAPAAAAGGAVALAPRTHVELQHDVEIVGRWRRPTMFNAE
jgi:hypothetical protein